MAHSCEHWRFVPDTIAEWCLADDNRSAVAIVQECGGRAIVLTPDASPSLRVGRISRANDGHSAITLERGSAPEFRRTHFGSKVARISEDPMELRSCDPAQCQEVMGVQRYVRFGRRARHITAGRTQRG